MNNRVVIARSDSDEAIPGVPVKPLAGIPGIATARIGAPRDDTVWYRQLWPWLLMTPPLASVIGGVALLWIAIASNDGLVTPESTRHAGPASRQGILTPAEAANCAVKDRACLNTPIEETR